MKPTIAQLSITVAELQREILALRNEITAMKQPKPKPQPKLPVRECIAWLNQHDPGKSYTLADLERAATHLN